MVDKFNRTALAAGLLIGLSACVSSGTGNGGGNGGGGSPESFDAFEEEFDDITGRIPTSDMPVSGAASYTGGVLIDIDTGTDTLRTLGDLSFSVAFNPAGDDGSVQNPVSDAQIDNIRVETSAGDTAEWDVTLTQEAAEAAGFDSVVGVTETTINAPVVGEITTRIGALAISVLGEVDETNAAGLDGSGTMLVTLGGAFFGAEGAATAGTATAVFDDDGSDGLLDAAGAGTYTAEQD